jgi:hypothetical protein
MPWGSPLTGPGRWQSVANIAYHANVEDRGTSMTAVAFDTLKLARKLRDSAEMSQVQAEGVADALAEAMSGAELATKSDLAELKAELRADLVEVEHHLEAKIAAVQVSIGDAKTDTLKTVMAMIIGAVVANSLVVLGAMFGLAKLLGH